MAKPNLKDLMAKRNPLLQPERESLVIYALGFSFKNVAFYKYRDYDQFNYGTY